MFPFCAICGLELRTSKMKRNRIVIPLDESQTPSGSARGRGTRRGLARLLTIVAVVLLLLAGVVVGGGYLWWQNHKSSPAYALAVLADAAQKNDRVMVDSILDTDKVCDDFVSQVRQRTGGSAVSSITSILPTQADTAVQTVSPKLKQTVHDELIKEVQRLSEPAAGKPFFLVALGITRFADIKEENNVAQVKLNVKDEHLQLTMQPTTRPGVTRWRITAVQDDKLLKLVADGITRKLPSSGIELPDQVHKQWDKVKK
jgi:hypothetical protein